MAGQGEKSFAGFASLYRSRVKGYYRTVDGKRVWVPAHERKGEARGRPAPPTQYRRGDFVQFQGGIWEVDFAARGKLSLRPLEGGKHERVMATVGQVRPSERRTPRPESWADEVQGGGTILEDDEPSEEAGGRRWAREARATHEKLAGQRETGVPEEGWASPVQAADLRAIQSIRRPGKNQTEVEVVLENNPYRATVLFSYETPVAVRIAGTIFATERQFGPTTSRHVNDFADGDPIERVPHEHLEALGGGMHVRRLGANETQVTFLDSDTAVLYSYDTPVAGRVGGRYYRSAERHSPTTSGHVNKWLVGNEAQQQPAEFFQRLVSGFGKSYCFGDFLGKARVKGYYRTVDGKRIRVKGHERKGEARGKPAGGGIGLLKQAQAVYGQIMAGQKRGAPIEEIEPLVIEWTRITRETGMTQRESGPMGWAKFGMPTSEIAPSLEAVAGLQRERRTARPEESAGPKRISHTKARQVADYVSRYMGGDAAGANIYRHYMATSDRRQHFQQAEVADLAGEWREAQVREGPAEEFAKPSEPSFSDERQNRLEDDLRGALSKIAELKYMTGRDPNNRLGMQGKINSAISRLNNAMYLLESQEAIASMPGRSRRARLVSLRQAHDILTNQAHDLVNPYHGRNARDRVQSLIAQAHGDGEDPTGFSRGGFRRFLKKGRRVKAHYRTSASGKRVRVKAHERKGEVRVEGSKGKARPRGKGKAKTGKKTKKTPTLEVGQHYEATGMQGHKLRYLVAGLDDKTGIVSFTLVGTQEAVGGKKWRRLRRQRTRSIEKVQSSIAAGRWTQVGGAIPSQELARQAEAREKTYPKFKRAELRTIFSTAKKAGRAAGKKHKPVPMMVQQRVNVLDDSSEVTEQWEAAGGVAGFAWVTIEPANSAAGQYAKRMLGARKGYRRGMNVPISEYGQSYGKAMAHGRAFAAVLREAGIDAQVSGRID